MHSLESFIGIHIFETSFEYIRRIDHCNTEVCARNTHDSVLLKPFPIYTWPVRTKFVNLVISRNIRVQYLLKFQRFEIFMAVLSVIRIR